MTSVSRPLRSHHQTAGSHLYNNFFSFDLILSGGHYMDLSLLNVHSHLKASFKKKKKGEKSSWIYRQHEHIIIHQGYFAWNFTLKQ